MTALLIRNYSSLSLAFTASSFRVTEENLVFETVQSGPYSSFEGTHFYILFDVNSPLTQWKERV